MRILVLETATDLCAAALITADDCFVSQSTEPRSHYRLLPTQIEDVLSQAKCTHAALDAIACDVGPGSFTGVRVGLASALGISVARQLPMIEFNSLEAIALAAFAGRGVERVMAVLDARMKETYFASYAYNVEGLTTIKPPQIGGYDDTDIEGEQCIVGQGAAVINTDDVSDVDASVLPDLQAMAPLIRSRYQTGQMKPPGGAVALYLRDKVAQTRAERGK